MTKRELIDALDLVPDSAHIRTSDDLAIIAVTIEDGVVYLEDDGDGVFRE